MENREWLYYLLNKNGLSYYRENGLLKTRSTPKPLRYTPDTWQDISIGYERSLEDWGSVRNFTLPQNFVEDGAEILRELFQTRNIEEEVYLLIQRQELRLTPTEYFFFHKYFYRGELDMSTGKDQGTKFSINIMEGGLSKAYKAYKSTKYEYDANDVIVKMDGIVFQGTRRFVVIQPSYIHALDGGAKEMLPMTETNSEGTFFNIYFAPQAASTTDIDYSYIQGENLNTNEKENGSVTEDVTMRFHYKGTIQKNKLQNSPFGPTIRMDIKLETNTGRVITIFNIDHTFSAPGGTWTFDFTSGPVTLLKNEKFFIYQSARAGNNNVWVWLDDVRFEYYTEDIYKTTYVMAKRANVLYRDIVQKVTSKTNAAVSSLLDSKQNYVITSGDDIRKIAGAKIKTSLDDFNKFIDVIENTGTGIIKNQLYLEKKEFFLQDTNVIDLGEVKTKEIEKAKQLFGSTFKIGYEHVDSDDVNGKYSFNNTNEYTLPIKRVTTVIERKTNYITDPYVIDLYRANLDGKTTTDDSKDNSVIALNIDIDAPQTLAEDTDGIPAGTTYYNLKRVTYDSSAGVPFIDKLYNIEDFTPARLLEKHMSYLNAILYQFDGLDITFNTTDKNRNLVTTKSGVTYDEDSNKRIGLSKGLFKPVIFTITPETRTDIVELLEDNPNRCFSFIHENGYQYRAFNLKIGIAPNTLAEQEYQLLAVEDQDLTTLKDWTIWEG